MTKEELIAKINALAPLIVTLLGCINAFLTLRGLPCIEIGDESITLTISSLAGIVGEVWSWWRNNNWTEPAREAQKVLNGLKDGKVISVSVDSDTKEQ